MRQETQSFYDGDGIPHSALIQYPEELVFCDTRDIWVRVNLTPVEVGRGIMLNLQGATPKDFNTSETRYTDASGVVYFNISRMLQRYLLDLMADEMWATYEGYGDATQPWQRMRPDCQMSLSIYYVNDGGILTDMGLGNDNIDIVYGCNHMYREWHTARRLNMWLYYPSEIDVYNAASAPVSLKVNGTSQTPVAINKLLDANGYDPFLKRLNILWYLVANGFVTQATDSFELETGGLEIADDTLAFVKDTFSADLRYCTEKAGVFLRWIATDGSIQHYLFDIADTTMQTSETDMAMTYLNGMEVRAGRSNVQYQQEVKQHQASRTYHLGAESVDDIDYHMLLTLATSPCVEMMTKCTYNGTDIKDVAGGLVTAYADITKLSTKWRRVNIGAGSFVHTTRNSVHRIGFDVVEPNMEVL